MESINYTVNGREFELQHHGVKGMKWGVRRYQNKDGSLTPAGKKRYGDNLDGVNASKSHKTAKRVAAAVVMGATVAACAALYAKNPKAVNDVISKVGKSTVAGFKKAGHKTYDAGKQYLKDARAAGKQYLKDARAAGKQYLKDTRDGIKEGIKEAPKKAAKKATEAVITGATMMAAKRVLDATVGKEEAARIFQANNNKKISSFWKVGPEDKDKEDDD